MHARRKIMTTGVVVAALFGTACGGGQNDSAPSVDDTVPETSEPATVETEARVGTVVVTYSVLGSIVSEIVGANAEVEVLVPNGMDPHDFEPSARDVEALTKATIVVANGLDLEEGLEDAIEEAQESGTPVFFLTDHVTLRKAADEHDDDEELNDTDAEHDEDHGHGSEDPHVWLDPLTVAEAVPALAAELGTRLGVDLTGPGNDMVDRLEELSDTISVDIGSLESCVLLTGHDSLGYFGARYGCEIVGSIVPGFSTSAEATAGELADLKRVAQREGVKSVFTEQGTPRSVADQIAKELGVDVVELPQHQLPDGGGYAELMKDIARAIVEGLA